jgi:SAM-dependent methyltransferase
MSHKAAIEEISQGGERVTHLYPNDVYFAHLSIYSYALQFARGKVVLDAGCGAGYGSHYFIINGAQQVEAIDQSQVAIQFCKKHFHNPNLNFDVKDLEQIEGYPKAYFDLIFASNVLEHVPNVNRFFQNAGQLLQPKGVLLIAVPPIIDDTTRNANLENRFHLNIWTPRQWYIRLLHYFREVSCVFHSYKQKDVTLNFANTPKETKVDEKSFSFDIVPVEDLYRGGPITFIFIARYPITSQFDEGDQLFVEDSFTRPLQVIEPLPPEEKKWFRRVQSRIRAIYHSWGRRK